MPGSIDTQALEPDAQETAGTARLILARAPQDFTSRTSYGEERRVESVVAEWADGRRAFLEPSREERISFALRDRYQAAAAPCAQQIAGLIKQYGAPRHVTVTWRYDVEWEGQPPRHDAGQHCFLWEDVAAHLT